VISFEREAQISWTALNRLGTPFLWIAHLLPCPDIPIPKIIKPPAILPEVIKNYILTHGTSAPLVP